jgi:polyisoprenoid-binding protein YceI
MPQTSAATLVPTGTWNVDPSHSVVEFGIKHLMITTVKGNFDQFEGVLESHEDGTVVARGRVKTESIDTREPQRDQHLRSPDFFDVEHFPEMTFTSKQIEPTGEENRFHVTGELQIRDVTREIELEAVYEGSTRDPWGNERIGVTMSGRLAPTDFGIDWNVALEAGGNLLGDRVTFTLSISAVKAA